MNDSNVNENFLDVKILLEFLKKYKKILVIVFFISAIFSSVLCLFIPPEYKSTIILFPTSGGSVSQSLITESQQKKDILKFGEEENVEQLMQMLMSSEIRNMIIKKFDLYKHYDIDPKSKYANTKLYKKYESNVKITRTKYMSIQVDVIDRDPKIAADIANSIAEAVDSLYDKIRYERAYKSFLIVEKEYENQKAKIKAIEDSLAALSAQGVIEVKTQTEMYSEQHAIAIATGNQKAKEEIEKKLGILAKYGSTHLLLKEQLTEEVKRLAVVEAKYKEAKIDLEADLPNTFIVSPAEPADKKYYPICWLFVSISVISTFILAVFVLILLEKFVKKKIFEIEFSELKNEIKKIEFELPKYEVMESYFKTKSIFGLILKWKWHLIILILAAAGLAALFSSPMFIKPKYQSSATLFPANIAPVSDESESEQMLEYLESNDIKFRVIDAFNLWEHYNVPKDNSNSKWKILKIYNSNINIRKTPNEAIIITATDTDPQIASDIVDSIIKYYNDLVLQVNIEKSKEIVSIYKREYEKKQREVDSLGELLKKFRTEYGLLDMTAQVEKYTEAVYLGRSLDEAREVLGNWKNFGAEYQKTDSLFYYAIKDLYKNKNIYESSLRDASKFQTYAHVVSKPYPADRKSYPIRWLIVLMSMLGAFVAGVIVIAIIEAYKKSE